MQIKECLHWLWNISKGYRFRILLNSMIGILYVAVSLLFIWFSKTLIDIATGQSTSNLLTFILLLISCILAQLFFSYIDSRIEIKTEIELRSKLRYNLFTRLMESRWMGRETWHTGDIINRLENDVLTVTDVLTRIIPSIVVTIIQFLGVFIFLCRLDIR